MARTYSYSIELKRNRSETWHPIATFSKLSLCSSYELLSFFAFRQSTCLRCRGLRRLWGVISIAWSTNSSTKTGIPIACGTNSSTKTGIPIACGTKSSEWSAASLPFIVFRAVMWRSGASDVSRLAGRPLRLNPGPHSAIGQATPPLLSPAASSLNLQELAFTSLCAIPVDWT